MSIPIFHDELAAGHEFLNWFAVDVSQQEVTDPQAEPLLIIGNYLLFVVPTNDSYSWNVRKDEWPQPSEPHTTSFAQGQLLDALVYIVDAIHQEAKEYAITQYQNMRK